MIMTGSRSEDDSSRINCIVQELSFDAKIHEVVVMVFPVILYNDNQDRGLLMGKHAMKPMKPTTTCVVICQLTDIVSHSKCIQARFDFNNLRDNRHS